jgi:hypothetical protein
MELSVLTAQQIRLSGLKREDVLSYDYIYKNGVDNYFLLVNGKVKWTFASSRLRFLSLRKIERMGLGLGWCKPQLTDEEIGLCEAAKRGENPFAYTLMCADPRQNVILPLKSKSC